MTHEGASVGKEESKPPHGFDEPRVTRGRGGGWGQS